MLSKNYMLLVSIMYVYIYCTLVLFLTSLAVMWYSSPTAPYAEIKESENNTNRNYKRKAYVHWRSLSNAIFQTTLYSMLGIFHRTSGAQVHSWNPLRIAFGRAQVIVSANSPWLWAGAIPSASTDPTYPTNPINQTRPTHRRDRSH